MLQPLAALCRPATLPSWGHRWGAAGRWPSPRARRHAGANTWWAARSGGLAHRGRVIEGRSKLQCCNSSRHPVGRRRCRAGITGGNTAGPSTRVGRQAGTITWWGGPVRKAVALLDNGALGGKGRFSLQSCNN